MISIPIGGKENAGSLDKITNMEFQIILLRELNRRLFWCKEGRPKVICKLVKSYSKRK